MEPLPTPRRRGVDFPGGPWLVLRLTRQVQAAGDRVAVAMAAAARNGLRMERTGAGVRVTPRLLPRVLVGRPN